MSVDEKSRKGLLEIFHFDSWRKNDLFQPKINQIWPIFHRVVTVSLHFCFPPRYFLIKTWGIVNLPSSNLSMEWRRWSNTNLNWTHNTSSLPGNFVRWREFFKCGGKNNNTIRWIHFHGADFLYSQILLRVVVTPKVFSLNYFLSLTDYSSYSWKLDALRIIVFKQSYHFFPFHCLKKKMKS